MKKIVVILLIALSSFQGQSKDKNTKVFVGDRVPDFRVEMTDGTVVDINDLRGKVVLLNFTATWCSPSRTEMATVQEKLLGKYSEDDFVFLVISREESLEDLMEYKRAYGFHQPIGLDLDRRIYSKFADITVPRNYLIDRKGKVILVNRNFNPFKWRKIRRAIEKEIGSK